MKIQDYTVERYRIKDFISQVSYTLKTKAFPRKLIPPHRRFLLMTVQNCMVERYRIKDFIALVGSTLRLEAFPNNLRHWSWQTCAHGGLEDWYLYWRKRLWSDSEKSLFLFGYQESKTILCRGNNALKWLSDVLYREIITVKLI